MVTIRYVELLDKEFWFSLDQYLSINDFYNKVQMKRGYVLLLDNKPIGLLRYNLIFDTIPFCTLLYIDEKYQRCGYGKMMVEYWQNEMKKMGYDIVLTSTQVDEQAQHFYRKLGYKDCGGVLLDLSKCAQPMEMFLIKSLDK